MRGRGAFSRYRRVPPCCRKMMKAQIHYFSATGNTKAAASEAALVLRSRGLDVDVSQMDPRRPWRGACDIWVVASPVYDFKPSLPALEFVRSACPGPGTPAVALLTHGGTVDMSPSYMRRALARSGALPFDWVALRCEDSWPVLRGITLKAAGVGLPDEASLAGFRAFWADLPGRIERGDRRRNWFRFPSPFSPLSLFYHRSMLGRLWFPIEVDMRKCTRCGLCVRRCPTGRMRIENFPRPWGECVGCYGCVNNCPAEAVNTWLTHGAPRYRGDFLRRTEAGLKPSK